MMGGRQVWLAAFGNAAPGGRTIYMPTGEDAAEEIEALRPLVEAAIDAGACKPFRLVAFAAGDWNRDYTPWPAPPLSGKATPFAGEAGALLAWLRDALMPQVHTEYGAPGSQAIMGYSLAGLFSLWALCEGMPFDGCASCSGSLWYDGWLDYLVAHAPTRPCRVYLSLGDREGKARNQRMAAVEAATEATYTCLKAQDAVEDCTFVYNPGGHFTDVARRQADALIWLAGA